MEDPLAINFKIELPEDLSDVEFSETPKNSSHDMKIKEEPSFSIEIDPSELTSDFNPWSSKNLKDFLCYSCPECDFQCSVEVYFYEHAVKTHVKAKEAFEPSEKEYKQNCTLHEQNEENEWFPKEVPDNSVFQLNYDIPTKLKVNTFDNVSEEVSKLNLTPMYDCHMCEGAAVFENALERADHILDDHKDFYTIMRCPMEDCDKIFYNRKHFDEHQLDSHNWKLFETGPSLVKATIKPNTKVIYKHNGLYHCPFKCGTTYSEMQKLEKHLIYDESKQRLISCMKTQWTKIRNKIDEIDVICDCCGLHYTSKKEFQKHQDLTCQICKKAYNHVHPFHRHMINVHAGYPCAKCDQVYDQLFVLKDHIAVVHDGKSPQDTHICEHCGKAFSNKIGLKNHINAIHGDEVHICSKCGESFASNKSLKAHERGNHEIPKCDICGKIYQKHSDLVRHKRLNHQDKAVRFCDMCQKLFANAGELYVHFCEQHPDTECPAKAGSDFYLCHFCQKVLMSKAALYTHCKLTHKTKIVGKELGKISDAVPTKCPKCDQVLDSFMECVDHYLDNHGHELPSELKRQGNRNRSLYCSLCDFQSRVTKCYVKHKKLHK